MSKLNTMEKSIQTLELAESEIADPVTGELVPMRGLGQMATDDHDVAAMLQDYAGAGISDKIEDSLIPVVSILQDNSGEVKRMHERRVDGAEAGMIIIRSLRKTYMGDAGLFVQPVGFAHTYVEWSGEPGEGLPVAQYAITDIPADAVSVPDPQNPSKFILRRKSNGNRLVDTRTHFAHILIPGEAPVPVTIPMSGSNHSTSRMWTNLMKQLTFQGRIAPSFFGRYHLTTKFRKRGASQSWFSYEIATAGLIANKELLLAGRDAFETFRAKPPELDLKAMSEDIDVSAGNETGTTARPDPANII
jgi:hypothetical protein